MVSNGDIKNLLIDVLHKLESMEERIKELESVSHKQITADEVKRRITDFYPLYIPPPYDRPIAIC